MTASKTSKPVLFAFFGTPKLSVLVLESLELRGYVPALIITEPDRPQGRGLMLTPTPVKIWATQRGIEVVTPESLKDAAFLDAMHNTSWEMFVVAMYGKIMPKAILDIPRMGCLNVHPSLLPKFRGPSPVLSAILADERETGVSIMLMDEKMDHGHVVAQARIVLEEAAWPPRGSEFEELLASEGGTLLAEVIPSWLEGDIVPSPQDHAQATYTQKFFSQDAYIDLAAEPLFNYLKIRAFNKSPRAYTIVKKADKNIRIIITDAAYENDTLTILRVIPEGKKEMTYQEFIRS